jgi:hypothetical protein
MTKVMHLCPRNSLFSEKVKKIAEKQGDECFLYETTYRYFCKEEISSILSALKGKAGYHLFFHRVPSFTVFIIKLRYPSIRYSIFWWGDDYYVPILPVRRLTQHCVKRSGFRDLLLRAFPEDFANDPWLEWLSDHHPLRYQWQQLLQKMARLVALYVASKATTIYSSPKLYRYARSLSRKLLRRTAFCQKNRVMALYSEIELESSSATTDNRSLEIFNKKQLTVMVCHSATCDVNVPHTLCILEELSKKCDVAINITGFLSYSGGTEDDRDRIEKSYTALASRFAQSVRFERRFLSTSELRASFDCIDVAFTSAYRDEGLTLLGMLSQRGKILCFNRNSINYDYFNARKYLGLMSHEEFFERMIS